MKKIIIFASIIVILFGGLAFLTNYQNAQKAKGNPYGKSTLDPATIAQLNDPNYQNPILPDELKKSLDAGETLTVYFYSPTCEYCKLATPILSPLAGEMGIDVKQFNLLEFPEGWTSHNIESTPTLVHYVDGKEVDRIVGLQEEEAYRAWLDKNVNQN